MPDRTHQLSDREETFLTLARNLGTYARRIAEIDTSCGPLHAEREKLESQRAAALDELNAMLTEHSRGL